MGTIKLRRGTGSPAGSLAQFEVAMDVAAKNLYVSTDGSNAVVLADNTVNTLSGITSTLSIGDLTEIEGTAGAMNYGTGAIGASILNLKTDNTGWDKGQLTLEDSNNKIMKMVGENQTSQNLFKYAIIMDPDGQENTADGFTGDYGFFYNKNYSDLDNTIMELNVFGAVDKFRQSIHGDYNNGSPNPGPFPFAGYPWSSYEIRAKDWALQVATDDQNVADAMQVDKDHVELGVPMKLVNLTTAQRNALTPEEGMMIYNSSTSFFEVYDGSWQKITTTAV